MSRCLACSQENCGYRRECDCDCHPVEWYVYMVECQRGSIYTGITTNVVARVKAHNTGKGAKYTRGRAPVVLKWCQHVGSKSAATKREREIKRLSRAGKLSLIYS